MLSCDKTNLFTFLGKVRSYEAGREARVDWEREERLQLHKNKLLEKIHVLGGNLDDLVIFFKLLFMVQ